MIDTIRSYIVFVLLHQWNPIPKEGIELLEKEWVNKPTRGLKLKVYRKICELNK